LFSMLEYKQASEALPLEIENEAVEVTELIASGISYDVFFQRSFQLWKQMSRIQKGFVANNQITLREYAVLDARHFVLTHSDPLTYPVMKKMTIHDAGSFWGGDVLQVVRAINHPSDGRIIGYLALTFDVTYIQNKLEGLKNRIFFSFLMALLFAVLISIGMSLRVSRPLKKLSVMARKIGLGDISISDFSSAPTEVQALAQALLRADQTILVNNRELAKLAMVIEQTDEIIVITDRQGVIEYVNASFERISGYSAAEVVGQKPNILKSGKHAEKYYKIMWDTLNSGKTWRGDFINRNKSGEFYEVTQSITPIFDSNNEVTGFASVQLDVTQQRQMQSKLQHSDRVESLGVLAGGIAHDFNNLLTAILGNASLAMTKLEADSPVLNNISAIEKASFSAADLCKQMLAYSGKGQFVIKPVNLSELVDSMGKLIHVSLAKNVVLKLRLNQQLPAIDADVAQMQQIVLNLITNASEAIEENNGVISITTGVMLADADYLNGCISAGPLEPGRFVFLEVSDTGCGMDAETQKKIFDPFFTTKFTGRGLGMSAMLGIVKGHRGGLRIYSEPGEGTTIKITFPISHEEVASRNLPEAVTSQWKGSGTALVIDDEETVREIASAMLKERGFSVVTANDGVEGVEMFRQYKEQITIVLLDMTMPRMNGEQCFSELRRISPDVRVLLSSGYNEQDATDHFAGKGLAGFIQKPYSANFLTEKIQSILG